MLADPLCMRVRAVRGVACGTGVTVTQVFQLHWRYGGDALFSERSCANLGLDLGDVRATDQLHSLFVADVQLEGRSMKARGGERGRETHLGEGAGRDVILPDGVARDAHHGRERQYPADELAPPRVRVVEAVLQRLIFI